MRKFVVTVVLMFVFVWTNAQIVADHSIVDHYAEIPQEYIDSVKTMLVSIPGESHSGAYRIGQDLLEQLDSRFQVQTYVGTTPSATNQFLRMGMHRYGGEYLFFSQSRVEEVKDEITDQYNSGNPFHIMGFGWCWDMTHDNDPGGIEDTVYSVRWAGRSVEGPDGNMRWGLNKGDSALTGNRVSMDSYFEAVESWIQYCEENSYPTRWIYSTGPVGRNEASENGFQREIKHDYIRDYVAADTSRILFDYADILCWSNSGEQNMVVWNDEDSLRPHAQMHPDNMMDYNSSWMLIPHSEDGDHIGEVGTVRMAKAMWWMLARMAGWDGNIPLRSIQVSAYEDSTRVMTGSNWQFSATISPLVATDTSVTWNVIPGTGTASISSSGVLRGGLPGMVKVTAMANDGSGVADTLDMIIAEPLVPVSSVSIATAGGVSEVDMGSTLLCSASVLPVDATNPEITWSVLNHSGSSTIGGNGLFMALTPGMVEVIATTGDGSGVADTLDLTVIDTVTYVTSIQISAAGGVTELETGHVLQFSATLLPLDATYLTVVWSVLNGSGSATISSGGLLHGGMPGEVKVLGSASDGSGVADTLDLIITGSVVQVSDVEILSPGGVNEVQSGEDLQLSATVLPVNATNPVLAWSVINGSGSATITSGGLLRGGLPGEVEVVALATDQSGMGDTLALTVTAPLVPVSSIIVSTAGSVTDIEGGATLQCTATVIPVNASNPSVVWSVVNGTGSASISSEGLLIAMLLGTVDVVATAADGSGVMHSITLNITSSAILVTDISIVSAGNVRAVDEGETLQFTAVALPEDAPNRAVTWSVDPNTGSADINQNGLLTALTEGSVLVSAAAQDGSGISSNFALTINGPNALFAKSAESSIVLYPNPSAGKFYLDAGALSLDKIQVFSVVGSVVLVLHPETGEHVLEIDLSDQREGAYFINAISEDGSHVHRVIISR